MSEATAEYDKRYLGGILFFNEHDFFEAHEVWESLWLDYAGPERRFYQGLIQAAVALYHFGNGNLRGAKKLFGTAQAYMSAYESPYLGLDHKIFWQGMAHCFERVLSEPDLMRDLRPDESTIPTITLSPEPAEWPSMAEFNSEDEDE